MTNIIKAIEFPQKEFATKEELFAELKSNKDKLIQLKRATFKKTSGVNFPFAKLSDEATKSEHFEEGFIYPVINTTNYLDSHNDVHLKGIWDKSVKEQQGKIFYLVNHDLEVGSVIAFPKDVEMFVREMSWMELGKNMEGTTEALIFKTNTFDYSNDDAVQIIKEGIDIEHSVRMEYVKLFLAVNSTDADFDEENQLFHKYINTIANREKVLEQGYFWGVEEAKILKEGSMVLAGSNDVTPLLTPENKELNQPTEVTDVKSESEESVQSKTIDMNYLIENFKLK